MKKLARLIRLTLIPLRFIFIILSLFVTIQVLESKSTNINVSFPQSLPSQSEYDWANAAVIVACIFLMINQLISLACFFSGFSFFNGFITSLDILVYLFSFIWTVLYITLEWHFARIWLATIFSFVPTIFNTIEVFYAVWLKEKEF